MNLKCLFGFHDWSKDCESCSHCAKTRLGAHAWSGCRCSQCGQARDESHDWDGYTCRICGKISDLRKDRIETNQEATGIIIKDEAYRHYQTRDCCGIEGDSQKDWLFGENILIMSCKLAQKTINGGPPLDFESQSIRQPFLLENFHHVANLAPKIGEIISDMIKALRNTDASRLDDEILTIDRQTPGKEQDLVDALVCQCFEDHLIQLQYGDGSGEQIEIFDSDIEVTRNQIVIYVHECSWPDSIRVDFLGITQEVGYSRGQSSNQAGDNSTQKEDLKTQLLDELDEHLGSFAVNLIYMRTDNEDNANDCFATIVSQANAAPCTAYAVIGELRPAEGLNPDISPGLFVGVVLHHWTLAALREGADWFYRIASDYMDMPDPFVEVTDKNYPELEALPFAFYKFKKVASSG